MYVNVDNPEVSSQAEPLAEPRLFASFSLKTAAMKTNNAWDAVVTCTF